jgi:hypothetical protein
MGLHTNSAALARLGVEDVIERDVPTLGSETTMRAIEARLGSARPGTGPALAGIADAWRELIEEEVREAGWLTSWVRLLPKKPPTGIGEPGQLQLSCERFPPRLL